MAQNLGNGSIFCANLCLDKACHVLTDLPAYNKHLYSMPATFGHQSFSLPFAFQANCVYIAFKTARCIPANRYMQAGVMPLMIRTAV